MKKYTCTYIYLVSVFMYMGNNMALLSFGNTKLFLRSCADWVVCFGGPSYLSCMWGVLAQLVSRSCIGRLQNEQFFGTVCCSMYVLILMCGTYVCLLHRYSCFGRFQFFFKYYYFRMTRLDTCAHTVCPKPCSTTCDLWDVQFTCTHLLLLLLGPVAVTHQLQFLVMVAERWPM